MIEIARAPRRKTTVPPLNWATAPRWAAVLVALVALAKAGVASAQTNDLGITPPPPPASVESAPLPEIGVETDDPSGAPQTAEERAAEDWRTLTGGASDLLQGAQDSAEPFLDNAALQLGVLFTAAALGGFLGARASARRRLATEAAAPSPAPRMAEPVLAEPVLAEGLDGEPPMSTAMPARDGGPGRRRDDREADKLLAFFRERFNVDAKDADGAIEYLTRLGALVESTRRKLSDAELELERLRTNGGTNGQRPAPVAASWELIAEAGRVLRGASQRLRGDADFAALAIEAQLEEWLRELAAQRAAHAEQDGRVDAQIVEEAWPHALFRTEALTLAYYPTNDDWRDFRLGLTGVATGFRLLLRREDVLMEQVRLLSPLDQSEGEVWSDTSEGLRELEPVRRIVMSNAGGGADSFVIDCESFGYVDTARDLRVRSKVIVFNRAEWR